MKFICHLTILPIIILADIERHMDGFTGAFILVNKGRLFSVIDVIQEKLELAYCMYACIQHLHCRSINYNHKFMSCELLDMDYDPYEADEDPLHDWWNYGTPPKGKEYIPMYVSIRFLCNLVGFCIVAHTHIHAYVHAYISIIV